MTVIQRFLEAVAARDFSAASSVMAPDAVFQLEDVINDIARMKLAESTLRVRPDEKGDAHLAMRGSGAVRVVAASGAGLESGSYKFTVELRRDSRRDEWRVWGFELQQK